MNKAIKYRVYPTQEQKTLFLKTFGCCRKVYNLMLADKIAYYQTDHKMLQNTPAQYKKDHPYLKEVDSLALSNTQQNLQKAFENFFNGLKKKKKVGYPKFKTKKKSRRSYTTNNQNGTVCIVDGKYIKLPKVGLVEAKIHRLPEPDWKLKAATISQSSDGNFYISLLFYFEKEIQQVPLSNNAIGLDYKSDGLYMDSSGVIGSNHKYFRKSQKKLAKARRKLSKKKGSKKNETKSNNYWKQLKKVNKIHRHVANQRLDHLHKKSAEIANQYDIVCVEDLNMKNIANRKFGNGKATMDNGYGLFCRFLEYKLADRGKYFVKLDKWYPSSQICHCCGAKKKLDLRERTYTCPVCGLVVDRDLNAAINIKNEGLRILNAS